MAVALGGGLYDRRLHQAQPAGVSGCGGPASALEAKVERIGRMERSGDLRIGAAAGTDAVAGWAVLLLPSAGAANHDGMAHQSNRLRRAVPNPHCGGGDLAAAPTGAGSRARSGVGADYLPCAGSAVRRWLRCGQEPVL